LESNLGTKKDCILVFHEEILKGPLRPRFQGILRQTLRTLQ